MKTTRIVPAVSPFADNNLYDALLLMVAGAAFEAQTRELKPFGRQRLTVKALAARSHR